MVLFIAKDQSCVSSGLQVCPGLSLSDGCAGNGQLYHHRAKLLRHKEVHDDKQPRYDKCQAYSVAHRLLPPSDSQLHNFIPFPYQIV